MNWKELHIGIDLGLKTFNHNLLGRLLNEEKDYLLNATISNLIHSAASDARHSIINTESYADIVNFYNILEPFIINRVLPIENYNSKYIETTLPKYLDLLESTGDIIPNVTYKVIIRGSTDLTLIGKDSVVEDSIFTWIPTNVTFVTDDFNTWELTIQKDFTYKIIKCDSVDFTNKGANDNNIGTIFTATEDHVYSKNYAGTTILEVLAYTPTWNGDTFTTIKSLNIFEYLTTNLLVNTNKIIQSNDQLQKGNYYKVLTAGSDISDIKDFGSEYTDLEVGYTFICTKTGTPNWSTSAVRFYLLVNVGGRLVKSQDIEHFLEHSYGSTISSPLITMGDGKLQIYHDNKFVIEQVILTYVRPPAKIDSTINVNCDVNVNLHPFIVDTTIQSILAKNNPQLFQTVVADNIQKQQNK